MRSWKKLKNENAKLLNIRSAWRSSKNKNWKMHFVSIQAFISGYLSLNVGNEKISECNEWKSAHSIKCIVSQFLSSASWSTSESHHLHHTESNGVTWSREEINKLKVFMSLRCTANVIIACDGLWWFSLAHIFTTTQLLASFNLFGDVAGTQ